MLHFLVMTRYAVEHYHKYSSVLHIVTYSALELPIIDYLFANQELSGVNSNV